MMSNEQLTVHIRADPSGFNRGIGQAAAGVRRFGGALHSEFQRVKGILSSAQGMLAGFGLTVGGMVLAVDTAKFEQDMRRLQVNLGASREELEAWRKEAFDNQKNYGSTVTDQKVLAESLQAAGLNMDAIRQATEPVSKALVVAKTDADALGKALGVAREQFGVDITSKAAAEELLDKMVVAGRLGNAELENLPDIFARVGGRAKEANFTLDQTLALTEALSQSEPQADRLATLVDSTLRIFTNAKYMQDAEKATGVKFFDSAGERRDPLQVIQDMKVAYERLTTDAQRHNFIDAAFGKTDMDTQRGLKKALEGETLDSIGRYQNEIRNAAGTIDKDLKVAMDNAVIQAERLKGAFRESVEDGILRPATSAFTNIVGFMMDKQENGGLGLEGGQMIKMTAATGMAALLGGMSYRLLKGGGMGGGLLGMGGNLAMGKAVEEAAGVQPVYVVNMPAGGLGGLGAGATGFAGAAGGATGALGKLAGAANIAFSALSAFGAGYSAGTAIREMYMQTEAGQKFDAAGGELIARVLAFFGNKEAQEAVDRDTDSALGEGIAEILAFFGNQEAQQALAINQQFEADRQRTQSVLEDTSQQAAQSVKEAGDAAAATINQAKIDGDISVRISAPAGFGVAATASGGGAARLNVGYTNTGAQ